MKSFVFDLYNTLIEVRTDEHVESTWLPVVDYFKAHGIDTDWESLCREFDAYWKVFNAKADKSKFAYPECDCVEQFMEMAKNLGGKLDRKAAAEALCIMRRASIQTLRLFDGTLELLDELRKSGAKIYLLSNAQAAFTPDEIKECGLSSAFDGVMLSSDYGCRKPDPAFFGMLFDKYGIDKATAVMVGDDITSDGQGAKDFGSAYVCASGGAAAHADELISLARKK